MLKLRLKRVGRRHDPSFRIVITEATAPPKGKYLESVGFYNASLKQLKLDQERIKYWLARGARPTDVVHNFLVKEKVIEGSKIAVHSTRARKKEVESAAKVQEINEIQEPDVSPGDKKAGSASGADVGGEVKKIKEEKIEKEDEKETESEKEKALTDDEGKKEEAPEAEEGKEGIAPTIAEGDVGEDKILDKEDKKE